MLFDAVAPASSGQGVGNCWQSLTVPVYLELQKNRPFFNRKSSFFRGNSPLSLHFQQKVPGEKGISMQFAVLWLHAIADESHANIVGMDAGNLCYNP